MYLHGNVAWNLTKYTASFDIKEGAPHAEKSILIVVELNQI